MKKYSLLCFLFLTFSYLVCEENQRTEYGSHDNHFEEYQQGVVDHTIKGPLAWRVLMPYTIQFLQHLFPETPIKSIAFCLNILLMTLTQLVFFIYLKNFLSLTACIAGILWLDFSILMGFASFMGVHAYESTDVCNLLFMALALNLLYKKQWWWLAVALFTGMLNRETPAFILIAIYAMWKKEKFDWRYLLLCGGAIVLPYLLLKLLIHPPQASWFLTAYLNENIPFYEAGKFRIVLSGYLKFFIFLGPLAFLAFANFKNKNHFLKTAVIVVPFFIPVHFIVGHVEEYRMWLPLFLFLIPLGMQSLEQRIKYE